MSKVVPINSTKTKKGKITIKNVKSYTSLVRGGFIFLNKEGLF